MSFDYQPYATYSANAANLASARQQLASGQPVRFTALAGRTIADDWPAVAACGYCSGNDCRDGYCDATPAQRAAVAAYATRVGQRRRALARVARGW